jgi:hypothetical protein
MFCERIRKISFLIHPTCWSTAKLNRQATSIMVNPELFQMLYEHEICVIEKQKAYITSMKEDELLIIYPIGESMEMVSLEDCGLNHLGSRCIILPRYPDQCVLDLPEDIMTGIARDLFHALMKFGYTIEQGAIKVLYFNRFFSYFIQKEIDNRALVLDQTNLSAEAFGEGFEQCAMTWKGMVASDLGWNCAIDNNYALSVSGAPFLIGAEFKERISLQDDIRIFFWHATNDRFIALYSRCGYRFSDSQRFAHLCPEGCFSEIYLLDGACEYPKLHDESKSVRISGDAFSIAVYEGGRKFLSDKALYIFSSPGVSYERFKDKLCHAKILS